MMTTIDHFRAVPGGIQPDDEPNAEGYCSRCLMPFFADEIPVDIQPYGTNIVTYSYCGGCRNMITGHC